MALMRFYITGAIPLPLNSKEQIFIDDLRVRLQRLKSACVVIHPGANNEEDITRFVYHICHHDTGGACEPEQDI